MALAIGALCLAVLRCDGAARHAVLCADKAYQIAGGRLVLAQRWGYVDLAHAAATRAHFAQARAYLADPLRRARPLVLEVECTTLAGSSWVVRRSYRLRDPEVLAAEDMNATAAAIALQMAFDVEATQEHAPWSTALPISAWQFEDLSSALFATIADTAAIQPRALALGDFGAHGAALVTRPARTIALPASASEAERHAFSRVRRCHSFWTRDDDDLEDPFVREPPPDGAPRA